MFCCVEQNFDRVTIGLFSSLILIIHDVVVRTLVVTHDQGFVFLVAGIPQHSTVLLVVQEKLDLDHIETVVGEDHDEEGGAGHDHDGDDTDTRHWKHGKYLTAESCVG